MLAHCQHGIWSQRSCETQLVQFMNDIRWWQPAEPVGDAWWFIWGFIWLAWTPLWDKIIPFSWGISRKISKKYQIIRYNIHRHLAFDNMLAHCQHGIWSQRSCETQLVQFMNDIRWWQPAEPVGDAWWKASSDGYMLCELKWPSIEARRDRTSFLPLWFFVSWKRQVLDPCSLFQIYQVFTQSLIL